MKLGTTLLTLLHLLPLSDLITPSEVSHPYSSVSLSLQFQLCEPHIYFISSHTQYPTIIST